MIKAILLATVVPFMAQHRNITPSNEVTTNFYGSVTGVVTRTYIAEHGGGGLEPKDVGLISTNVVTNVVTKSYVENLGINSGNVLHFNGGQSTEFVEGTAKLIEFVNAGKPMFCLYGGNLWTRCESITPSTVSGVQVYYLSFVCNNPSAYANGVSNPLIITCALFPTLGSHQVFAGTYRLLSDNLSVLTNSVNFKAAVETFIPPMPDPIVTNLYGVSRENLVDGDRKVYVKLPYSVWTNDVAGGYGSIPAGLVFTPTPDKGSHDFAWEAKKNSDTYRLYKDNSTGGMAYYDLRKNNASPFPQPYAYASSSATELNFNSFKMYRYGSGDTLINTDTLALGSVVSNLDTKVETRTARQYLAYTIGNGSVNQAGLLGLYNSSNGESGWPFSKGYWNLIIYPEVQEWVGSNYVPNTRKVNGQPLTSDITIEGMSNNAVVITDNKTKTKAGAKVTGENMEISSTDSTTVKGAIENTQAIVQTWESFLDGSNVVFSITNYISGTYVLDTAKLRILEMRNGAYQEVYNSRDEINLHINDFSNSYVRTSISALADAVAAQLANKADKDWGKYTSSGGAAPSNTVYMTAPNTVFAGGMEYKRVAVGLGSIAVLTTKGAPTYTQGDEGTFKFQDDGGTNYFGFAKSDSYTLGCHTDGITVTANIVTLLYEVTMSGTPCIWYKESLEDDTPWEQLNTPDGNPIPGASKVVTWDDNPDPGTKVCYLNYSEPSGFFKATIEVAGAAKFMTNMPADLQRGIFCTNTVNDTQGIIKPSYNGSQVIWTWSAQ